MSQIRLRLPELRARRRMSQRQVAAVAGLRPDTISALERGQAHGIQFETLARLCDALGCQPGELFELERNGSAATNGKKVDEAAQIATLGAQIKPLSAEERERALALLEESRRSLDEQLAERGGVPFDESWPLINAARDERSRLL
ncbi:MAG TPA: helix-turn-helix transcriptional regulator [Dehalococcoidia bacterium]|nr:helix-turn-helix transcriptional regulator [Dehalococcoidia bacterium]